MPHTSSVLSSREISRVFDLGRFPYAHWFKSWESSLIVTVSFFLIVSTPRLFGNGGAWQTGVPATRRFENRRSLVRINRERHSLSFSMADHLALPSARVHAGEMFFEAPFEQRPVRDVAEIFRDEPDVFFGGHPTATIEPGQIHRP
jgi:hypothetical protein